MQRTGTVVLEDREAAMQQAILVKPDVKAFYESRTGSIQYVVSDPITRRSAIIDPVLDFDEKSGATSTRRADMILDFVDEHGLTVEWILDTHPHADHFSAAKYLSERTAAPIGIGEQVVRVQRLWKGIYNWPSFPADGSQWDRLFKDGERFRIGELDAYVIFSPGHTLASVTYVIGDAAFIHDTVFMPDSGTARADFPGGSAATLWKSIQKILSLRMRRGSSRATIISPEVASRAGRAPWRSKSDRTRILRTRARPNLSLCASPAMRHCRCRSLFCMRYRSTSPAAACPIPKRTG